MNEENWGFCNEQDRNQIFQYSALKQSRLPHCMMVKIQAENFAILNKVLTSNGLEPMTRTMSCMNFIDLVKLNESNQPKQLFRSKTTDFGELRWREKALSVPSTTNITVKPNRKATDVKSKPTYEISLCFENESDENQQEIQEEEDDLKGSNTSLRNKEMSLSEGISESKIGFHQFGRSSCESVPERRLMQPDIILSSSCTSFQMYTSHSSYQTDESLYDSEDEESTCSHISVHESTSSEYCLQDIDRISIGSDLFVMKKLSGMRRADSGSDISIDAPSTLYASFDMESLQSLDDSDIPPPGKLRKFHTFEDLRELPFRDDSSEDEGISTYDTAHDKNTIDENKNYGNNNITLIWPRNAVIIQNNVNISKLETVESLNDVHTMAGANSTSCSELSDSDPSSIDTSHNTLTDFDSDNASIATEINDDTFSDFDKSMGKTEDSTIDLEFDGESLDLKYLFKEPDETTSNIDDDTQEQERRHNNFFRRLRKNICNAFRKLRCY